MQRPAAFVPETKNVAELLREMQREKQHMRIVIDEYGGVAGLVTIEDLLEAIVGIIADEHDEAEEVDEPVREADGTFVVPGSFEVSRLRELFAEPAETTPEPTEAVEATEDGRAGRPEWLSRGCRWHLPQHYEATTHGRAGVGDCRDTSRCRARWWRRTGCGWRCWLPPTARWSGSGWGWWRGLPEEQCCTSCTCPCT